MKKILFHIKREDQKKEIFSILDQFKNISIFPSDNNEFKIELFLDDSEINKSFLKNIKEEFKNYKLSEIKNQNWVVRNINDDKGVESDLFYISQGLSTKVRTNKKFRLVIPANNAFGTGYHPSTFLVIQSIEYLTKRKKYFKICDLGSGSGILSFILNKITKRIITSVDIDYEIKQSFISNLKSNYINNVLFLRSDGLKSMVLRKKKFDLIVSNMLCNTQKRIVKDYYKSLEINGEVVVSGILVEQENEILSYFNKFNFKLKKKTYSLNWVALIFFKTG